MRVSLSFDCFFPIDSKPVFVCIRHHSSNPIIIICDHTIRIHCKKANEIKRGKKGEKTKESVMVSCEKAESSDY